MQGTSENSLATKQNEQGKPLLKLIKNLINLVDHEESTILTNSQLMAILHTEFNIEISKMHSLEVDIYVNILKKFLKSWPNWDSVNVAVETAKKNNGSNLDEILDKEYQYLKKYLPKIIDLSIDSAKGIVSKVKSQGNASVPATTEGTISVHCTRNQLNHLFFQHPKDNNLFNITDKVQPKKFLLGSLSFEEILNSRLLEVTIKLDNLEYSFENCTFYQRTLVNRKLNVQTPVPIISKDVHQKNIRQSFSTISKSPLLEYIHHLRMKLNSRNGVPLQTFKLQVINLLLNTMEKDISNAPDKIGRYTDYMYFLNQYPYVRYFSTKSDQEQCLKHDLHLEEYILPSVTYRVSKFNADTPKTREESIEKFLEKTLRKDSFSIAFKCSECDVKFENLLDIIDLEMHFTEVHSDEKDWQCSNCKETFSNKFLMVRRWKHDCNNLDAKTA